jgi:SAM-dependent methyltransferase
MLLYATTILLSAFLLFQVQPVIAKIILPWFGGSAAVWITCLVFFQVVLLLGYLYAHLLVRYLKPRVQTRVHVVLLLGSLLALRVYPNASWKPSGNGDPALGILGLLAVTVGLPYFLLSSTGPLLQAWYARQFHGAVPYRLYALSNAGSMFALLGYPFLFEPVWTTHQQAGIWSAAYGGFLLLCIATAIRAGRAAELAPPESAPEASAGNGVPGAREYAFWLLLPTCASVLLLAISNHIAQNVAAIPFLWVLPLSLYLLSFILCFDGRGWFRYRRYPHVPLMAILLGGMALAVDGLENAPIVLVAGLFALGLFACCMVCHGELTLLKPHPRYLTQFYLAIAAGGALGGFLVGFVAPHLFHSSYELELGMALCAAVTLAALANHPSPEWMRHLVPGLELLPASLGSLLAGYLGFLYRDQLLAAAHRAVRLFAHGWTPTRDFDTCLLLLVLLWLAGALLVLKRGVRLGWVPRQGVKPFAVELLALMLIGYLGYEVGHANTGYRRMVRNFYGALKVTDSGPSEEADSTRCLLHGTINHGEQFLNPARRRLPTTYYAEESGIGMAIRDKQQSPGRMRVGVIGLGTGTTAAYGRAGDCYRFYEINPQVRGIAETDFTFLSDCPCRIETAIGDARLSLEAEAPQNFDVLAVDAFSGDSIPVHLLTREAMQLYFRHLKPDGILAVHITNRYLDLLPVVDSVSRATGRIARLVTNPEDEDRNVLRAKWVLVTAPVPGFDQNLASRSQSIASARKVRLWTDEYSNLFQILKWEWP